MFPYKNSTTLLLISAGILSLNTFFGSLNVIGIVFMFVYLAIFCGLFRLKLYPKKTKNLTRLTFNLIIFFTELIILGTIVYYTQNLTNIRIIAIFWIVTLINIFLQYEKQAKVQILITKVKIKTLISTIGYLITAFYCFILLYKNSTVSSIRSPWEVLPVSFFMGYLIATLLLILIIRYKILKKYSLYLLMLHYAMSSMIALIIYRVGYGFDQFVHIATENRISQFGEVLPKPFYYIGQYSLVVIFSKLSGLSISLVDKFLVPGIFSLIPVFLYSTLGQFVHKTKIGVSLIPVILFLFIPFSSFVVTTPYNLSILFFILSIIVGFKYTITKNKKHLYFNCLLSLSAFFIHPLSGLPSLFYSIIIFVFNSKNKLLASKITKTLLIIIFSIGIPAMFFTNAYIAGTLKQSFDPNGLKNLGNILKSNVPDIMFQQNFNLMYDILYFWGQKLILLILLSSILGAYILYKKNLIQKMSANIAVFFIILVNVILLQTFIKFPELIVYEQNAYSSRILTLSLYLILPFFFAGTYAIYSQSAKSRIPHIFFMGIICLLLGVSLFFSYPRHNKYETGHGYSVSISDIKAIKKIDEISTDGNYIVLANQIVGAGALKIHGFKKYFPINEDSKITEHYFYSIPTGGPLYQKYLDMVYKKTSRETMKNAANMAGVDKAFFVINDYWTDFEKIIQNARASADETYVVDGGKVYVFEYDF